MLKNEKPKKIEKRKAKSEKEREKIIQMKKRIK